LEGDKKNKHTFMDLYAGCGGLSLGLMMAGWRGLLAVEKDPLAFQTLKRNLLDGDESHRYEWPSWLPKSPVGIGKFAKDYRENLLKLRGRVTLIAGGPPCQGFSTAGRRKKSDPRNLLFRHYVEIVSLVRPPLLLLENVRGITMEFSEAPHGRGKGSKAKKKKGKKKRGRPVVAFSQKIKRELEKLGYDVQPRLLRAADFGVPQLRPRYFMIAVDREWIARHGCLEVFGALEAIRREFLKTRGLPAKRPVSAKEALSDLETRGKKIIECVDSAGFKQIVYAHPRTTYQRLLHGSMNGAAPNSLRLVNHRSHIVKRFRGILGKCRRGVQLNDKDRKRLKLKKHCTVPLHPDKPSHTLTTLPDDLLHYSEPRILTVREYARLQSFPDWYEFRGKYTTGGAKRVQECPRYTQVGNAVPPFLAECLGLVLRDIARQLGASRPVKNTGQKGLRHP
jgi:DNA (cytosine-5)-methyltransferase 1